MIEAVMVLAEEGDTSSAYECFLQRKSRKIRFTIENRLWAEHGWKSIPKKVKFTLTKLEEEEVVDARRDSGDRRNRKEAD